MRRNNSQAAPSHARDQVLHGTRGKRRRRSANGQFGRAVAELLDARRLLSTTSPLLASSSSALLVGPVSATVAASAPKTAAAAATTSSGDIVGVPVTGDAGITVSVSELMTREHGREDHPTPT